MITKKTLLLTAILTTLSADAQTQQQICFKNVTNTTIFAPVQSLYAADIQKITGRPSSEICQALTVQLPAQLTLWLDPTKQYPYVQRVGRAYLTVDGVQCSEETGTSHSCQIGCVNLHDEQQTEACASFSKTDSITYQVLFKINK